MQNNTSQLLVFAHRLEARAFLDHYSWQALSENLYKYKDLHLLVCGEGVWNALFETTNAVNKIGSLCKIYNLGLAASLDPAIEINQIIEVRSIYKSSLSQTNDMEFKSFTTSRSKSNIDLVSVDKRVFDTNEHNYYKTFGKLIDREAWGIAFVAQKQSIPIEVYKIISDHANISVCSDIKETAESFSNQLLKHFLEKNKDVDLNEEALPKGFYFTQSQRAEYLKLCSITQLNSKEYEEISKKDIHAKEKTKILIDKLKQKVDPALYLAKSEIDQYISKYKNKDMQIAFDPNLEDENFRFSFKAKNTNELNNYLSLLSEFDFKAIQQKVSSHD